MDSGIRPATVPESAADTLAEYDLHTRGARHSFEPPYDGNDQDRNKPLAQAEADAVFEAEQLMVREAVSPNGKSFPNVVWSWAAPKGYDARQASAEATRSELERARCRDRVWK